MTDRPDHEALHELLLRRLDEIGVAPGASVGVAELHRRLIPYPLCRETLGLATKAEYDLALLRLLADEDRLRASERGLREAVRRELDAPEPSLGILHRFAASEVRPVAGSGPASPPEMAPSAPRVRPERLPHPEEPPRRPAAATHETERRDTDRIPGKDDLERLPEPPGERPPAAPKEAAPSCRACRAALPAREGLRFCPRCGADQSRWACASCGSEVERGWRYCAMCGTLQPR